MERTSRIDFKKRQLYVSSGTGEIAYSLPSIGRDEYRVIGTRILSESASVPTGALIAPLVREIYCPANKYRLGFSVIRNQISGNGPWFVYNRNLFTREGMFSVDDVIAVGCSQPLIVKTLDQKLKGGTEQMSVRFSSDGTVRFAPKGSYICGEIDAENLASDGAVIAQYGVDGAKLMAEAASTLPHKPETLSFETVSEPTLCISSFSESDSKLLFYSISEEPGYGCAFPIISSSRQR